MFKPIEGNDSKEDITAKENVATIEDVYIAIEVIRSYARQFDAAFPKRMKSLKKEEDIRKLGDDHILLHDIMLMVRDLEKGFSSIVYK